MDSPTDLRLAETELAELRRAMSIYSGTERRRHVRHPLPPTFALVVRIQPKGGGTQTFTSTGRDLSASGMSFFHPAYVHTGTPCALMMRTLRSDSVSLKGTVVRCRHLSGRIHEVGVLFEHEIEVSQFVQGSTVPVNRDAAELFEDIHARMSGLLNELRSMVDQRASHASMIAKIREMVRAIAPESLSPAEEKPAAPAPPATDAKAQAGAPPR